MIATILFIGINSDLEIITQLNTLLFILLITLIVWIEAERAPVNFYFDLSKVLDCLSHDIILLNLQHYGVCDWVLNLMKSYFDDRKQFVQFPESISEMKFVHKGVPQGSIFEFLLLLVYINDVPNSRNFLLSNVCR